MPMPRAMASAGLASRAGAPAMRSRGVGGTGHGGANRPRLFRHVVGDLDLAGDDVGARRVDLGLHVRADQLGIVLVERVADAFFGQAEYLQAGLPGAVLRRL